MRARRHLAFPTTRIFSGPLLQFLSKLVLRSVRGKFVLELPWLEGGLLSRERLHAFLGSVASHRSP